MLAPLVSEGLSTPERLTQMSTRKASPARRSTLFAGFDQRLSFHLQAIRAEIDRSGGTPRGSESLAAIQDTVERLRVALQKGSGRRLGDMAERLDELEYPFAKLQAFFAHKKSSLDRRATEIMAEYVRDRMLEIRVIAKALDARP
jgi:hypothetical protein